MNELFKKINYEEIFIDTSAWFALMHVNDKNHLKINSIYSELLENNNNLITSNVVVGETYTLMRYKLQLNSEKPFKFLDLIYSSLIIKNITVDKNIEIEAVKILKKYSDHKFSYVDAISFALMKKRKLKYALTLDKHFKIAGFVIF